MYFSFCTVGSTRQPKMCLTKRRDARRRLSSRSPWNGASCSDSSTADLQRLVRQLRGLGRLVELAERVGEQSSAPRGNCAANFSVLREVEEVPVLLLLHDLHQPEAGQLDVEDVRLVPRREAGRLELERAQRRRSPTAATRRPAASSLRLTTSKPSRNATSPEIGTLSGPIGGRGDGLERGDAGAVAIDLELDRAIRPPLAHRNGGTLRGAVRPPA